MEVSQDYSLLSSEKNNSNQSILPSFYQLQNTILPPLRQSSSLIDSFPSFPAFSASQYPLDYSFHEASERTPHRHFSPRFPSPPSLTAFGSHRLPSLIDNHIADQIPLSPYPSHQASWASGLNTLAAAIPAVEAADQSAPWNVTSSSPRHSELAIRFDSTDDRFTTLTYLPGLVDGKQQFNPSPDTLELSDQRRLIIVFIGLRVMDEAFAGHPLTIDSIQVQSTSGRAPKFCRKKSNIRGGPNRTQKQVLQEGKILSNNVLVPSTFWWLEPLGDHTSHVTRPFMIESLMPRNPNHPPVLKWYKMSMFVGASEVLLRCNLTEPDPSRSWYFDILFVKPSPSPSHHPSSCMVYDPYATDSKFLGPLLSPQPNRLPDLTKSPMSLAHLIAATRQKRSISTLNDIRDPKLQRLGWVNSFFFYIGFLDFIYLFILFIFFYFYFFF